MVNVQLQDLFPMEDIFTTLTFCSNFYLGMVAWCGGHIPAPMNEIINMDIFSFSTLICCSSQIDLCALAPLHKVLIEINKPLIP